MSDDERDLLLLVAGYIQRLESSVGEQVGQHSLTADKIAALIARIKGEL
jgi:hypothetical protein